MRRTRLVSVCSLLTAGWVTGFALCCEASSADSERDNGDGSLVRRFNTGFHLSIAPMVVVPTSGGSARFAISLEGRYGIDFDSLIVAPGARIGAYFLDPNVYLGMPTLRLVLPLGFFGPFVEGGAGIGNVGGTTGAALLAGAGFLLYVGSQFGFGVAADYEKITGTNFSVVSIGPSIMIAF